jgi:hypothetical protein
VEDVGVLLQFSKETGQVMNVVLPVRIGTKDEVHSGPFEALDDRGFWAAIVELIHHRNLRHMVLQTMKNVLGSVSASIINDDDLEIRRQPGKFHKGAHHGSIDRVPRIMGD